MSLQRNLGFFGFLRAFGVSGLRLRHFPYGAPGTPHRSSWFSRLISGRRRSRWSRSSMCWRLFVITTW
jgi:hypothetical protein